MNLLKNYNIYDLKILKENENPADIKRELIDEGNIIVHEIPKHNLGYHIYYYHKDIYEELKRRFGNKLVYFDDKVIIAKTCHPKNGDPIGDVLYLYGKQEIDMVPYYKDGVRTVHYADSSLNFYQDFLSINCKTN